MWLSTSLERQNLRREKQNMCTSCRILHDPIVFGNLMWWGKPHHFWVVACVQESTYAGHWWLDLFKVLPRFPYVRTGSNDSIYDTSIIEVADIPCRNSPYYVAYTRTCIFEPSVYLSGRKIKWRASIVAYSCDKLLASRTILAGIRIPPIPWLGGLWQCRNHFCRRRNFHCHCCRLPSLPAGAENSGSRRHCQVRVTSEACCWKGLYWKVEYFYFRPY